MLQCEHHFVPIIRGRLHVAYISGAGWWDCPNSIALCNIMRRPQVQERMTRQIAENKKSLGTEDVAVVLVADHLCVASRGVKDTQSSTITADYHGAFSAPERRAEFMKYLELNP
ncbi:MAG: GTP cyclohydrolase I [Bacteroidia bacterium]